jgi:hypothetical protein
MIIWTRDKKISQILFKGHIEQNALKYLQLEGTHKQPFITCKNKFWINNWLTWEDIQSTNFTSKQSHIESTNGGTDLLVPTILNIGIASFELIGGH